MGIPDIISVVGLIAIMCLLFKTNRGDIKENKRNIEEIFRDLHSVDKKVSIILAVHEMKYGVVFKKAVDKVNGEENNKKTQ